LPNRLAGDRQMLNLYRRGRQGERRWRLFSTWAVGCARKAAKGVRGAPIGVKIDHAFQHLY
jgi:hypothetical protein